MKIKFNGLGWKSKIALKRATYNISINKLVAEGCCLKKGDGLYSYLAEDEKRRKQVIFDYISEDTRSIRELLKKLKMNFDLNIRNYYVFDVDKSYKKPYYDSYSELI